jgi:hypothetical protein
MYIELLSKDVEPLNQKILFIFKTIQLNFFGCACLKRAINEITIATIATIHKTIESP